MSVTTTNPAPHGRAAGTTRWTFDTGTDKLTAVIDAVTHGRTKPDAGDLRDLDARY